MNVIEVDNVNSALLMGMLAIKNHAHIRESRYGDVLVIDGPVTTTYEKPDQRVLFSADRDANPFFHFMEGLWMIAGRNDVAWISQFSKNIEQFSDDGVTFHGGYGARWRDWFMEMKSIVDDEELTATQLSTIDQLKICIDILKDNPDDRRVVLQMWDPEQDLNRKGKDFPCNLCILFSVSVSGRLDMTVMNRSNDMIWGAYGANAVHMSMLQEYVASAIGIPIGKYHQVSNNFHAYIKTFDPLMEKMNLEGLDEDGDLEVSNEYSEGLVKPFPMVNGSIEEWDKELGIFMSDGPLLGFKDKFFRKVACPMLESWRAYKNTDDPKRFEKSIALANSISATDWRKACVEWLERRQSKAAK